MASRLERSENQKPIQYSSCISNVQYNTMFICHSVIRRVFRDIFHNLKSRIRHICMLLFPIAVCIEMWLEPIERVEPIKYACHQILYFPQSHQYFVFHFGILAFVLSFPLNSFWLGFQPDFGRAVFCVDFCLYRAHFVCIRHPYTLRGRGGGMHWISAKRSNLVSQCDTHTNRISIGSFSINRKRMRDEF